MIETIKENNVPLSGARDSLALAHAKADYSFYSDAYDVCQEAANVAGGHSGCDGHVRSSSEDSWPIPPATTTTTTSTSHSLKGWEREGGESKVDQAGKLTTPTKEVISWSILSDDEMEAEMNRKKWEAGMASESSDSSSDGSDFMYRGTAKSTSTASTSANSVLTNTSNPAAKCSFATIIENQPAAGSSASTLPASAATFPPAVDEDGDGECSYHGADLAAGSPTPTPKFRRPESNDNENADPPSPATLSPPVVAAAASAAFAAIVAAISIPATATGAGAGAGAGTAEAAAPGPHGTAEERSKMHAEEAVDAPSRDSGEVGGIRPLVIAVPRLPSSPQQLRRTRGMSSPRVRPLKPLMLVAGDSDMESMRGSSLGSANPVSSAARARRFFETSPPSRRPPTPLFITTPTSAGSSGPVGSAPSYRHPSDRPLSAR